MRFIWNLSAIYLVFFNYLIQLFSFQPTLSYLDVQGALSLDPNNSEADFMNEDLKNKAEMCKERVSCIPLF